MTARLAHGLVIGKFYPPHAGHVALVRHALATCEQVTVQVHVSSVETLPGELRARWLREELPQAHVVVGRDDHPVDFGSESAWDAHVGVMRALLAREEAAGGPPARVDAVVTSDAYGAELARRLDATWLRVDPGRRELSVSGEAVRADPARYWWALPAGVRAHLVRRVVVLGAESTGTTTLARALSAHLGLPEVPEFGRQWSAERPGGLAAAWHTAEFDLVAREQSRIEDAAARVTPRPLLVCDTDAFATTLWHERYVGRPSPSVVALAAARRPDLYLLTGDEIPFVQDGLRDGEHVRHAMQERFREELAVRGVPWLEVSGTREERLATALAAIGEHASRPRPLAPPLPALGGERFLW